VVPVILTETEAILLQSVHKLVSFDSDAKKVEHPLDLLNRVALQVFVPHHQQRVCRLSLYNVVVDHVLPFLGLPVDNGFPFRVLPYIKLVE
jgi:hypothetical protein